MNITVKGKNFDPRATYWWPNVWYQEAQEARWITPIEAPSSPIPITQDIVHFQNVPNNAGFAAGFYTSPNINDIISGPYMFAATNLLVLEDKAVYVLDFQGGIAIPIVTKSVETSEYPGWTKMLVALMPWGPLDGPPLPMGFFPPWPLSIGNWMAIPGYPKTLSSG